MGYIHSLVEEVILPFEKYLMENANLGKYLPNEEAQIRRNLGISRFAVAIFMDLSKAKEIMLKSIEVHNQLGIDKEVIEKNILIFFRLYQDWTRKYLHTDKYFDEVMDRVRKLCIHLYAEHDKQIEDEFLFFEDEGIDEAIEHMHYQDHKKISVIEYFELGEILEDDIQTIIELKDDSELFLHKYSELGDEYIYDIIKIILTLSRVLFATSEFKDVGYALQNFSTELEELDVNSLNDTQKTMAYTLLSQINEDITNWIDTMFIKQDAVDIHYFDASFLANITQFGIMIELKDEEESGDEDDFLF